MTPKFHAEIRAFLETEIAFWQAQGTAFVKQNVAESDALLKVARERIQAAAEAQSGVLDSLWKHNVEAVERGRKILSDALNPST